MRSFLAPVLLCALAFPMLACGDDGGEHSFDTLPDCVADHISLGEAESIAHCLVDFFDMNFADQAACVSYVTANGGYETSREEACTLYFQERGE